tara:strand:- start:1647 stop:1805 length:159 start_codon:yes stop_codon:yes gene_type:complete
MYKATFKGIISTKIGSFDSENLSQEEAKIIAADEKYSYLVEKEDAKKASKKS